MPQDIRQLSARTRQQNPKHQLDEAQRRSPRYRSPTHSGKSIQQSALSSATAPQSAIQSDDVHHIPRQPTTRPAAKNLGGSRQQYGLKKTVFAIRSGLRTFPGPETSVNHYESQESSFSARNFLHKTQTSSRPSRNSPHKSQTGIRSAATSPTKRELRRHQAAIASPHPGPSPASRPRTRTNSGSESRQACDWSWSPDARSAKRDLR